MKMHIFVCLFAMLAVALARPDTYPTKYDDFNIPELLSNKRLLKAYVECGLDAGPCSAEGAELKSHIAEGLENNCEKCSDRQRDIVKELARHFINKEQEYWQQLSDKYDPTRKYAAKYEKELREVQE